MIDKIKDGVVIDHIARGKAVLISWLLGLDQRAGAYHYPIAIGMNFDSRLGLKDFIKVGNFRPSAEQLAAVALVAPNATINIIEEYEVVSKFKVSVPKEVVDLVICPDQFCITNHEQVKSRFHVIAESPLTLRCHYCETSFYDKLIKFKKLG
ncbi:aspartate carbamoyltransferase regulatory subunit [bacterium]|nr:aspartate carbamoyltransferase regulatory subunit [candidate division CSSED10-310 bacterium]